MPNSAEDLSTEDLERMLAARRQAAIENATDEGTKYRMGQNLQAKNEAAGRPPLTPTSARAWKKASADTDLPLPSGHVCRVKRPGLPKLLSEKLLPDMLTPIAQKAVDAGMEGMPKMDDLRETFTQPEMMTALFEATDRIAAYCVLEPHVEYHMRKKEAGQADQIQESYKPEWEEIPADERDPDVLYTDDIEFNDKMFIFQFVVGGSRDLEEFRRQTG
jgi:hypothetical protein